MVRRFLWPGAILLLLLSMVPACNSDRKTGTGTTPTPTDQAPPAPKPGGGRPG